MKQEIDKELLEMLERWSSLSEAQQRAFQALTTEIDLTNNLMANSVSTLSLQFQTLAFYISQQSGHLKDTWENCRNLHVEGQPHNFEALCLALNDGLAKAKSLEDLTDLFAKYLAPILRQNAKLKAAILENISLTSKAADNVGHIITHMQFQDRAAQHLQLVKDSLDVMSNMLLELSKETDTYIPDTEFDAKKDQLLMQMIESFNLSEVKERFIRAALKGEKLDMDATETSKASDDIDLF